MGEQRHPQLRPFEHGGRLHPPSFPSITFTRPRRLSHFSHACHPLSPRPRLRGRCGTCRPARRRGGHRQHHQLCRLVPPFVFLSRLTSRTVLTPPTSQRTATLGRVETTRATPTSSLDSRSRCVRSTSRGSPLFTHLVPPVLQHHWSRLSVLWQLCHPHQPRQQHERHRAGPGCVCDAGPPQPLGRNLACG